MAPNPPPGQPNYRAMAAAAARKYGIDPNIFLRQIGQESGFDPKAHSGAGAQGIAQFMPGTAAGYHINPYNPSQALDAAARMDADNLHKYGSYEQMLSAYNSGNPNAYKDRNFAKGQTFNYVRSIMGGQNPGVPQGAQSAASPIAGARFDLIKYLMASNQAIIDKKPQQSIMAFLQNTPQMTTGSSVAALQGQTSTSTPGNVIMSKGADRPGVHTSQAVLDYVSQISGIAGRSLTIGTGTNHNEYVAGSNRVSDHWAGNAADIPASGARLTQLGQDALIAAGANPAWARKQKGGVYNINGHQIIFNSNVGGNHYNHLHVSAKG